MGKAEFTKHTDRSDEQRINTMINDIVINVEDINHTVITEQSRYSATVKTDVKDAYNKRNIMSINHTTRQKQQQQTSAFTEHAHSSAKGKSDVQTKHPKQKAKNMHTNKATYKQQQKQLTRSRGPKRPLPQPLVCQCHLLKTHFSDERSSPKNIQLEYEQRANFDVPNCHATTRGKGHSDHHSNTHTQLVIQTTTQNTHTPLSGETTRAQHPTSHPYRTPTPPLQCTLQAWRWRKEIPKSSILMFHNCEGQSHKTVSTDHNF